MPIETMLPVGISFFMLILAFLTYTRAGRKETAEEAHRDESNLSGIKESLLKANMKLDQVCATTNETRSDIKALNKDMTEIDRRVTMVERDLKTAFNAIDELKGKVN